MEGGFTCECGEEHEFPGYVYAHWNEILIHTCERCGAKHEVLQGRVSLIEEGEKK